MSKIASITAKKILDSRGEWTIEVEITLDNGVRAKASIPQGKSRGAYEAVSVDADRAVKNIKNIIAPALKGMDVKEQSKIDQKLIKIDGTPQKSKIGANAILGASLAIAKAAAISQKIPLWLYFRKLACPQSFACDSRRAGLKEREPSELRLFANMINGGLHAGNNLEFQEYLVIPKAENISEEVKIIMAIYQTLKGYLEKNFGKNAVNLGDEGGFAPNFKNNLEPFEVLEKIAKKSGLAGKIDFGLDAAASNINKKHEELSEIYGQLKSRFNILYLEDPFKEDDFKNFTDICEKIGKNTWITGDDLTVTNVKRMEMADKKKSVNAVIIKPNQIGTLTETLEAIKFAKKRGWKVVVSHRSGETNDDFIADLAYGVCADGIKLGAPARGERIAKYDRLLEIEKE